jgi:hypothetical protein
MIEGDYVGQRPLPDLISPQNVNTTMRRTTRHSRPTEVAHCFNAGSANDETM